MFHVKKRERESNSFSRLTFSFCSFSSAFLIGILFFLSKLPLFTKRGDLSRILGAAGEGGLLLAFFGEEDISNFSNLRGDLLNLRDGVGEGQRFLRTGDGEQRLVEAVFRGVEGRLSFICPLVTQSSLGLTNLIFNVPF
jgi:hypothetical protein